MIIKLLFHLLPFLPLFFEKYYLAVAALILVFVPYIKSAKFSAELDWLRQHGADEQGKAIQDLIKIRSRWRMVTFISEIELFWKKN